MRHHLNLNWLRSFEAAARLLSFTTASRELGLTQTAVSQHIKALELKLGQKLFVRRPKSLQLTDVGKAYLTSVREALETIRDVDLRLIRSEPEKHGRRARLDGVHPLALSKAGGVSGTASGRWDQAGYVTLGQQG